MNNYQIIKLGNECKNHFLAVEHGDEFISLSIHTGRDYQSALLDPNQAIELANMLLDEVGDVRKAKSKNNQAAVKSKEGRAE